MSVKPQSILAAYVGVSIMVVVIPIYYYVEGCRIEQRYGAPPDYCAMGGGWTFFSPWSLILFVPVVVSLTLVILRLIRWQSSAIPQRSVVFTLTSLSEVSLMMTILFAFFGASMDDYHASKQCVGWVDGVPPEYKPYCIRAMEIAILSGALLPIQVAFCIAGIALSYLYFRYF